MPLTENLFPRLESRRDIVAPDPIALELQSGLMTCAAVNAAVELRIFDALEQPKSARQLAQELKLHEPSLHLLLQALVSIDLFAKIDIENEAESFFGLTDKGRVLLQDEMAALVRLWGAPYQWDSWKHLSHTIRTGRPALEASYGEGSTIWSYLGKHPEEASTFQEGLAANSRLILPALLSSYDFAQFQTVADMGGGLGELSKALFQKYPLLHLTLFDRKEVIEQAIERGISSQIQLMVGDFFRHPPDEQDAYIFKNVLMDWSDTDYVRILLRCVGVLAPAGCILIVEPVLSQTAHATAFTRFFALQMAMMMRGAHHRTLEEHQSLIRQAGLMMTGAVSLGLEHMIIECRLAPNTEVAQ